MIRRVRPKAVAGVERDRFGEHRRGLERDAFEAQSSRALQRVIEQSPAEAAATRGAIQVHLAELARLLVDAIESDRADDLAGVFEHVERAAAGVVICFDVGKIGVDARWVGPQAVLGEDGEDELGDGVGVTVRRGTKNRIVHGQGDR